MRPDRILVGEVRGAEVWDMLQAMNTGHDGSLTTIHANSAHDALSRLEMMVAMTGFEVPVHVVRQYIASGISLIVQVARLAGGVRRVMQVSEIVPSPEGYLIKDIFGFEQTGVNEDGIAVGEFFASGHVPGFLTRIRASGAKLNEGIFKAQRFACAVELPPEEVAVNGHGGASYVTRK
jgi:pilus assembly protein CpaF